MQGVRILDLSVALTGPLAVSMLADQGASVIKVERPPFGDSVRYIGTQNGGMSAMFQLANRGKQAITMNLTDPRGVELILDLAAEADVVVQNFRPGAADRMGIGYDAVRARNNDIIYISISGFGPTGPYSHRRVYDTVIQAQSGLADNQTGLNDPKPVFLRQLAADKITAYTACQAISAALFARERGRGGQHLELAMIDACIAFLFLDGAGHEVALDGDHTGPTAAVANNTALAMADGFLAVAPVTDAEFHGLAGIFDVDSSDPGLATIGDRMKNRDKTSAVMVEVRAAAATVSVAEASAALDAAQVPFGIVTSVADVPFDAQVIENEVFFETEHPVMGRVRQTRPPVHFRGTPAEGYGLEAPTMGQHTDEIVAGAGWGDRLAELRADGVVS